MSLCIRPERCGSRHRPNPAIHRCLSFKQSMRRVKQFRNCYSKDNLESEGMNCCSTEIATGDEVETDVTSSRCQNCKGESRPVSRKTMLLMLKPHLLEQAMTGTYSFCASRDCPVVYFEEQSSQRFTTEDIRIVVGVKALSIPYPCATALASMRVISATRFRERVQRACLRELLLLSARVCAPATHAILRECVVLAKSIRQPSE